jgi:hypothetical protein
MAWTPGSQLTGILSASPSKYITPRVLGKSSGSKWYSLVVCGASAATSSAVIAYSRLVISGET